MGNPVKQLEQAYDDNLIIPEPIQRTILNYKAAHHGWDLDERDKEYIDYNTLREQRKDTEELTIQKIQRLYDRDSQKQYIVVFQKSRCKDFTNNYVTCPIVEKLGVVPRPIVNISNDPTNRVKEIQVVETQNDYYIPFSKEKLIELFESSKDKHKIVCYVGYTRPTRVHPDDTIEGKRIIWNQDKFVNGDFSELIDTSDPDNVKILDTKTQYILPNKIRNINKSSSNQAKVQRVDSLSDLLPKKKSNKEEEGSVNEEVNDQLSGTIVDETNKEYEELKNELKVS